MKPERLRFSHVVANEMDKTLLKDVSFQLFHGEILGILGLVSSGNNALSRLLSGMLVPNAGKIFVDDVRVDIDSPSSALELGIYCIHPESTLIKNLSVAENLLVFRNIPRQSIFINRNALISRGQELLSRVCTDISSNAIVQSLNKFQQLIVHIAKALSFGARLIVFNTIADSYSEKEMLQLFNILNMLKEQNISILFVTNNLHKAIRFCDRITVLNGGVTVKTLERRHFSISALLSCLSGGFSDSKEASTKRALGEQLLSVKNMRIEGFPDTPISLSLHKGEIVGLIDFEGEFSGIILDALYGLLPHTEESITLNGKKVALTSPQDAFDEGLALVQNIADERVLLSNMDVMENIYFPAIKKTAYPFGIIRKKFLQGESEAACNSFGLDLRKCTMPLRGQMRIKALLSRIDLYYSQVLLMKNPTAGLNYIDSQIVYNYMRRYANENKGILFVSSDIAEILDICNRFYIVTNGNILEKHIESK
ncbi:MAG: ATP-binding cassette domain-containing protein [Acetivibrionales bacterium]